MILTRVLRALSLRRRQLAHIEPKHDELRCYSPAVEEHLRRVGLIPMPMEDLTSE